MPTVSRRGRTVAGTSAKKNRVIRRQARLDAQRKCEGRITAPKTTTPPDDIVERARRLREEATQ